MVNHRLALAVAGMLGVAISQPMAASTSPDMSFAQKAAAGGLAEVALGQLTQLNAGSPQVKRFGQKMMTDHQQANEELQQIAQKENITLPSQPDSKDQAEQRRLSSLRGAAFDSTYAQDMVRDHQQDVAEFQREVQSGKDPVLKAFAQKTLPVLRQHLQMAQALTSQRQ